MSFKYCNYEQNSKRNIKLQNLPKICIFHDDVQSEFIVAQKSKFSIKVLDNLLDTVQQTILLIT